MHGATMKIISATDICAKANVCGNSRHALNVFCPVMCVFAVVYKQEKWQIFFLTVHVPCGKQVLMCRVD
jgi:hypothetical protein